MQQAESSRARPALPTCSGCRAHWRRGADVGRCRRRRPPNASEGAASSRRTPSATRSCRTTTTSVSAEQAQTSAGGTCGARGELTVAEPAAAGGGWTAPVLPRRDESIRRQQSGMRGRLPPQAVPRWPAAGVVLIMHWFLYNCSALTYTHIHKRTSNNARRKLIARRGHGVHGAVAASHPAAATTASAWSAPGRPAQPLQYQHELPDRRWAPAAGSP